MRHLLVLLLSLFVDFVSNTEIHIRLHTGRRSCQLHGTPWIGSQPSSTPHELVLDLQPGNAPQAVAGKRQLDGERDF